MERLVDDEHLRSARVLPVRLKECPGADVDDAAPGNGTSEDLTRAAAALGRAVGEKQEADVGLGSYPERVEVSLERAGRPVAEVREHLLTTGLLQTEQRSLDSPPHGHGRRTVQADARF